MTELPFYWQDNYENYVYNVICAVKVLLWLSLAFKKPYTIPNSKLSSYGFLDAMLQTQDTLLRRP